MIQIDGCGCVHTHPPLSTWPLAVLLNKCSLLSKVKIKILTAMVVSKGTNFLKKSRNLQVKSEMDNGYPFNDLCPKRGVNSIVYL